MNYVYSFNKYKIIYISPFLAAGFARKIMALPESGGAAAPQAHTPMHSGFGNLITLTQQTNVQVKKTDSEHYCKPYINYQWQLAS